MSDQPRDSSPVPVPQVPTELARRLSESFGDGVDPGVTLPEASDQDRAPGEAASPPSMPGRSDRRYQELGELARGGMGAVHGVYDHELRRHIAMKVILGQDEERGGVDAVDRRQLERFLEEAQVTAQLDHPGVVPVHELGLDGNGRVYFTMKLVRGEDLRSVFAKATSGDGGWSITRALGVLLRVCEAVSFAHSKGVIHRDLKPGNVMVGKFGEVYVMDWGLARVTGQVDRKSLRLRDGPRPSAVRSTRQENADSPDSPLLTMDGAVLGTPAYMPPEQAEGHVEDLGPESDVYSVGAMLYQLCAGQMPYVSPGASVSARKVLEQVRHGPPPPLAELAPWTPPELLAICDRAMARNMSERYGSVLELAEDLRSFLENRVVQAYRTGALVELRKWVQRNKALAASIFVAVVLALGGVSAVALVTDHKNEEIASKNRKLTLSEAAALASAAEARDARAQAEERLADFNVTASIQKMSELEAEEASLWPARERMLGAMDAWLERTDELLLTGAELDRVLGRIRDRAETPDASSAGSTEDRGLVFADPSDAWLYRQLLALEEDLVEVRETLLPDVRERRERAARLEAETVDAYETEWTEAILGVLDSELYGGLELPEQVGLVPIGASAQGYQEFWHVESGTCPERDEQTRKLEVTDETGVVLVLLRGGTFWMGSQDDDPKQPNYDDERHEDEVLHEVTLAPFFISRYELTQGQYLRLMGENPSAFGADHDWTRHDWAEHPVENLTWYQARDAVRRGGLSLPTEAQWEYAARAGTRTQWWGTDAKTLKDAVNLADQVYERDFNFRLVVHPWDDGYAAHAAVGTFPPNPFGLHEVVGNVWEWCADWDADYRLGHRPGDGALPDEPRINRIERGGGFSNLLPWARSANRDGDAPEFFNGDLGVRPAMGIER